MKVLLIGWISIGLASGASGFDAIVAFGDSYTDTGNAPSSPPDYWNGRFSNGPLWIEYLAQQLGFAYNPSDNFAVSGTESNELGIQINNFPGTSDSANVLFTIWSGNNDFGNHLNIGYNDAGWDSQINSVVSSLTTASDLLYQKGARQIVLFNQLDLTRVPYILNAYSDTFRSYIAGKIQIFNTRLAQAIPNLLNSHPGLQVYLFDIHSDFNYLLDNYQNLGFTQSTLGAVNDPALSDKSFSGPGADYVFWDSEHPTTKTHALIAKWLANLLPPPVPPNPPPTLSISVPGGGNNLVAPATLSLDASVVSNGWPITQVSLFENGALLWQGSSPPYAASLPSVGVGSYNLSASMTYGPGSVVTANPLQVDVTAPVGTALPSPWQDRDIGSVGLAGNSELGSNGTFIVSGSGNDIWDVADAFHFAYQSFAGNATIIARVTSLADTDGYAKAGLMFRESTDSNAVNVLVFLTPNSGDGMQSRTNTGATSAYVPGNPVAPPYWLRLQRTNDTFNGYDSLDGTNWAFLGSVTTAMGSNVLGGVAVTSHNNSLLCTATLDNIQITRPAPLVPPWLRLTRLPTNFVQLTATGSIGSTFICEVSTNLNNWYPLSTNLNSTGTAQIQIPPSKARWGFFRVLLTP